MIDRETALERKRAMEADGWEFHPHHLAMPPHVKKIVRERVKRSLGVGDPLSYHEAFAMHKHVASFEAAGLVEMIWVDEVGDWKMTMLDKDPDAFQKICEAETWEWDE